MAGTPRRGPSKLGAAESFRGFGTVFMIESEFVAIEEAQSRHEPDMRPAWRSPSVTRIDLARTLIKPGSGGDGGHATGST